MIISKGDIFAVYFNTNHNFEKTGCQQTYRYTFSGALKKDNLKQKRSFKQKLFIKIISFVCPKTTFGIV